MKEREREGDREGEVERERERGIEVDRVASKRKTEGLRRRKV